MTTQDTIRRWRTSKPGALTQQQLAVELGRAIATIARWEIGKGEPSIDDLRKMERLRPGLLKAIFHTHVAKRSGTR